MERVIEAWEAREKRFSSAVISWQERKVSIGLKNRIALLRRTSDDSGTADLRDDEQVVHVFNRRLAFADGKIYYDDDEPALFVGQGINPQRFKVEANSTQFKRIMETDAGIDFKKTGLITSNIRHLTSLATLKPVLAHFRPILSGDSQYLAGAIISDEMEQLDDSRCVVVSVQNPAKSGQQTLKLWLDINQGFIVRRTITETDGNITSVRNIAYKEDSGSGELVPAHWKYSAFEKNGRLFLDYESLAVELIINRGIDYDPSVQFTPGTLVKDHAVDGPEQIYFVLEDGSRRPVTEDELKRRVTPELLAVTTPGMAGLPGKRSRAVRYIVVAMLAVLCAAIIYRITLSKHIARRLSD